MATREKLKESNHWLWVGVKRQQSKETPDKSPRDGDAKLPDFFSRKFTPWAHYRNAWFGKFNSNFTTLPDKNKQKSETITRSFPFCSLPSPPQAIRLFYDQSHRPRPPAMDTQLPGQKPSTVQQKYTQFLGLGKNDLSLVDLYEN